MLHVASDGRFGVWFGTAGHPPAGSPLIYDKGEEKEALWRYRNYGAIAKNGQTPPGSHDESNFRIFNDRKFRFSFRKPTITISRPATLQTKSYGKEWK